MTDDAYLSTVVGKDEYVAITFDQFQLICKDIERDPELMENLEDYRKRAIAVIEGDDPVAFADLPLLLPRLDAIVEQHVLHPRATAITVDVLLRYLKIK
jgi:hypothetical protein